MARSPSLLAKLARPDAAGLVARERLFKLLDGVEQSRFAWVSGPGGSGKTSLVSSWLDHGKKGGVWYRVDAGDRDPATFFHYLGVAAQGTARGKRRPLPHLTPEYLAGLGDFARRYFRDLFARLTLPTVVVFDSLQEVAGDSPLQQVIAWALNEVPPGMAIVCMSRNTPGAPFARHAADAAFVHVNWNHLRLNEREALEIATASGHSTATVPALLDLTQGWTAGLVLMLRAQADNLVPRTAPYDTQHGIFDYFAGEILAATDDPTRDFLVRTAVLPAVPAALAAQLTGFPGAAELLAELHRNHFFTERRVGLHATYDYHPLFRQFLLAQAQAMLPTEELAALRTRAAEMLEQAGEIEAAVQLRIDATDWPDAIRLICQQAPGLLGQGRWQTLQGWIAALPGTIVESQPWLQYWSGVCSCMTDPGAAQRHFEAAHGAFRSSGDFTGTLLACAGVLEAMHFQFGEQGALLPWINELDGLLAADPALPPEIELRVIHGLLGVWFACPTHPLLPRWVERARNFVQTFPDVRAKAGPIALVTGFCGWSGEYGVAQTVLQEFDLNRRVRDGAPLSALMACIGRCGIYWQTGEHAKALDIAGLARAIAEESGVRILDPVIAAQGVYIALSAWDAAGATQELARMAPLLHPQRRVDINHYHFLRAGALIADGQLAGALEIAQRELPIAEALGVPFMTASYRIQYAQMLVLDSQCEAALVQLAAAMHFARAMPSHILQFQALMVTAWAHLRGRSLREADEALREGLAIGRGRAYMNCHPLWVPEMMRDVFARALEAEIEADYVRRFIRQRGLSPGKHYAEGWPWPVRVYTLGRFELHKEGTPMHSAGKAKQRVLDLLKAIIALGPHGVTMEALAGRLWPEAEGDAARDALRVALHRLRKLLDGEQAIDVSDGRVSLGAEWCWVDAVALERMLDEPARDAPGSAEHVLHLYRGHFLPGDEERPWMLAHRDRLRSKFLRFVQTTASDLERGGDIEGAINLYRKAIELEPLAEGIYRRLMDGYARTGRRAEALDIYRRCRQMLSVVLGIKPTPETEALHAALHAGIHSRPADTPDSAYGPVVGE
jgi:ATP/maltotriose-dependent transcriptional regulator MalT/DNA-binding SARP family transcriptional activator